MYQSSLVVKTQKGTKLKRKAGKTPIKSDEKQKKANLDWYEHAKDGLSN